MLTPKEIALEFLAIVRNQMLSELRELDTCWPWPKMRDKDGYGVIEVDGCYFRATHLSLEMNGRKLHRGEKALHSCDNPPCFNPRHLFAGTQQQNMRDMAEKGRGNNGSDKLVTVICNWCKREFQETSGRIAQRQRISSDGTVCCSRSCASRKRARLRDYRISSIRPKQFNLKRKEQNLIEPVR